MNLNIQETIGGVFFLILIFLLLSNASAFNTIVTSGGNFLLEGVSTLQGHAYTPVTADSNSGGLLGSLFGTGR